MIIFSDFDETLHPRDDEATFTKNLEKIREFRERGNKFCIATGRSQASLGRVWPEYKDYLDYAIVDNGAICLDGQGAEIFQETMPLEVVEDIAQEVMAKYGDEVQMVFYREAKEWQEPGLGTTKVRCWTRDAATAQAICGEIDAKYGESLRSFVARTAVMTSLPWVEDPEQYASFVDTMTLDAGKHNAVRRLAEKYPEERIVTVGDDLNDLEMIREFDGYAVQNSMPEVLEIVKPDHVVGSVAELIERMENGYGS